PMSDFDVEDTQFALVPGLPRKRLNKQTVVTPVPNRSLNLLFPSRDSREGRPETEGTFFAQRNRFLTLALAGLGTTEDPDGMESFRGSQLPTVGPLLSSARRLLRQFVGWLEPYLPVN